MKDETKKSLGYCFGMLIGNILVTPFVNRTLFESLLVAIISSILWLFLFGCLKDFLSFLLHVIKIVSKLIVYLIAKAFLFVLNSNKERKS